jgi:murein hydrolase activator
MRKTLTALWFIAVSLAPIQAWAQSSGKKPAPPATPEIAEKRADLGELRSRIESMRKELNASEEDRADAADRLRESERQISRLQRELNDLSEQRGQLQKKLKNLEQQSADLATTLKQQQTQLEKLLYRQYLRGSPDSLQMLLNGDDPNQMARDLHYLAAIAHTRADLMSEIHSSLEKKKALAADAKSRADELLDVEKQQQERHSALQKQRETHKKLHAEISDKVKAQRKEIGTLQKDEKRLSNLITRLNRILAAQAAAAAAAAAKPKPKPETPPSSTKPPSDQVREPARVKTVEADNAYEPVAGGNFVRQRGSLRLPVKGAVQGRFGAAREGGGTWRGLFIRANSGSEVKAVANGRVVFAEWMRGFGNLLIIDHGDAYLSIYGNNDSLLKEVGQMIKGGDTVATVGNSGGNPNSGLYFEIRHQGQPVDPMKWASLK